MVRNDNAVILTILDHRESSTIFKEKVDPGKRVVNWGEEGVLPSSWVVSPPGVKKSVCVYN